MSSPTLLPSAVRSSPRTPHFDENAIRRESLHSLGSSNEKSGSAKKKDTKWTLGILADRRTNEVPGTVLLLSRFSTRNIPLGLQHEQNRGRRRSRGSISGESERRQTLDTKKRTPDGQVILDPQPDDSLNDPLNWQQWRRDTALWSLGFYCMLGGGMTPVLAAGFNQVAADLDVSFAEVARTTGFYMMGLGVGSVIASPTAIIFGKRPVYLLSSVLFILASVWCALAPNYANLATARVFQGIAVSPVECLPSATIAEIFFLHERAFRVGIYTLLLLGGKNLIPLVSAAIIQSLGWRWVFWIVALSVGFGGVLLFLFVPETFWDRTPRPRALTRRSNSRLRSSSMVHRLSPTATRRIQVGFTTTVPTNSSERSRKPSMIPANTAHLLPQTESAQVPPNLDGAAAKERPNLRLSDLPPAQSSNALTAVRPQTQFSDDDPSMPHLHNLNSPYYLSIEKNDDYLSFPSFPQEDSTPVDTTEKDITAEDVEKQVPPVVVTPNTKREQASPVSTRRSSSSRRPTMLNRRPTEESYTTGLRVQETKPWGQSLKPWNGRLNRVNWWKAAVRPAILFAYPSVLWSAMVYALSVGWLIVLSESVSHIYSNRESYNFDSLQIGLVYMSPFIGGVLGTAVAGKVSDIIVRFMARRNNGVYEPEYRLVMAIPIAISTTIGLMGFGWSAKEHDAWIVPTIFFGVISFGCCVGSTTAITFCVDSYRQYAGEALVTLNFSKNIFHGLIWSLFFPQWLEADGERTVFIAIGGIQLGCMLLSIPMYIFGKRARMWTVRSSLMDRF